MRTEAEDYDVIVIGSGPAGQKAAIEGAQGGRRVLVIEREAIGGACVHQGTIPSKTMRESALALHSFRRRTGDIFDLRVRPDLQVQSLLTRLREVVSAHERYMLGQLRRNEVTIWQGLARFESPRALLVQGADGSVRRARGKIIVIASGSRPRTPPECRVDHEHILDSDSILSLTYLPESLAVLGSGVIACEYASVFAALGVNVIMIDRGERPLMFIDRELSERFVADFERGSGRYLGRRTLRGVAWDGVSRVVTTLDGGEEVQTDKALVALGRVAFLTGMNIEAAGLAVSERGHLPVDGNCRTAVPHIYAVGDVIGPPALASAAMEQGRRAMRHALGLNPGPSADMIPAGIYTIPEISSVGLTEVQAIERHGGAVVGRAPFSELARGQIAAIPDGLLKLVSDPTGRKILGVQIVGEGASELIHLGQLAMIAGMEVDAFIESIFNFPTLAEGYRVAALEIAHRRPRT